MVNQTIFCAQQHETGRQRRGPGKPHLMETAAQLGNRQIQMSTICRNLKKKKNNDHPTKGTRATVKGQG